jgi:putative glutamine amidotransferase
MPLQGGCQGGIAMARQDRPFIGINADFMAASKSSSPHARLHAGYFDVILAAGGLPVVIPPLGKKPEIEAILDRLDGILLSGGLDLDPRRLQMPPHRAVQPMAERREESDRILASCVLERQMPVLGVGVGMQLLNVMRGGTLYAHLPEDLPRAMPHRDKSSGPHRHLVLLKPDTHIEEIYGGVEILVNSDHHQAVHEVGTGMRVSASAPDGVVEAIEAEESDWFCVGVQWHPESETASALDMQLFEAFLQACLAQARPLVLAA